MSVREVSMIDKKSQLDHIEKKSSRAFLIFTKKTGLFSL